MGGIKSNKIKIGITMGDPAGIGPEIIKKALKNSSLSRLADFIVIGDKRLFKNTKNFRLINLNNLKKKIHLGKVDASCAKASVEYVEKAVELFKGKQIDCLVTCPISKEAMQLAGLKYVAHTELLQSLCAAKEPLMLLLNQHLKCSLVTRHTPLKEVPNKLNKDNIYKTIILTHNALRDFFKIRYPRLVVLALNPHASDGGALGKEEQNIIKPAINQVKDKIRYLDGPLPADTGILKLRQGQYDCAIAMYHDQALIPLKLTDPLSGVNLTYGLPFVRTSPLHGTAFDIAGKGRADPSSLIAAIKLAIRCTQNLNA